MASGPFSYPNFQETNPWSQSCVPGRDNWLSRCLSSQERKKDTSEFSAKPFEKLIGGNLRWTRIPFRGCSNDGTPTSLMLQKPRQSSVGIVPWLVYVTWRFLFISVVSLCSSRRHWKLFQRKCVWMGTSYWAGGGWKRHLSTLGS